MRKSVAFAAIAQLPQHSRHSIAAIAQPPKHSRLSRAAKVQLPQQCRQSIANQCSCYDYDTANTQLPQQPNVAAITMILPIHSCHSIATIAELPQKSCRAATAVHHNIVKQLYAIVRVVYTDYKSCNNYTYEEISCLLTFTYCHSRAAAIAQLPISMMLPIHRCQCIAAIAKPPKLSCHSIATKEQLPQQSCKCIAAIAVPPQHSHPVQLI